MHDLESVLENETHKLIWAFEIQTDHEIPIRRPNLEIINKKWRILNFGVSSDYRVKLKKSKKKDKYLNLVMELKKTLEYESDVYINRK